MSLNQVILTLQQILTIVNPPEEIVTVAQYRSLIAETLGHTAPLRGPGRPLVYGHSAYEDTQWKAIKSMIAKMVKDEPELWTFNGVKAKEVAKEQTASPLEISLDNGLIAEFSHRLEFHPKTGKAEYKYPPIVVEPV